jgi:hypothetical protein
MSVPLIAVISIIATWYFYHYPIALSSTDSLAIDFHSVNTTLHSVRAQLSRPQTSLTVVNSSPFNVQFPYSNHNRPLRFIVLHTRWLSATIYPFILSLSLYFCNTWCHRGDILIRCTLQASLSSTLDVTARTLSSGAEFNWLTSRLRTLSSWILDLGGPCKHCTRVLYPVPNRR